MTNTAEITQDQESFKIQLPNIKYYNRRNEGKWVVAREPYTFKFYDKASYLAWRAMWKATYMELSQTIRDTKTKRANYGRSQEFSKMSTAAYQAWQLKRDARDMMSLLNGAKKLSQSIRQMADDIDVVYYID